MSTGTNGRGAAPGTSSAAAEAATHKPRFSRAFWRAAPHLVHIGWATLTLGLGLQVASYNRDKKAAEGKYEALKSQQFEPKDFITDLRKGVFDNKWADELTNSSKFASAKGAEEQAKLIRRKVLTLLDNYSMLELKRQRENENQASSS